MLFVSECGIVVIVRKVHLTFSNQLLLFALKIIAHEPRYIFFILRPRDLYHITNLVPFSL